MVTYLQTSNLAGAMHTTCGSPEKENQKEKEKATRAKANPTKGKAADWVNSSIGTPKTSRHINANAPSTKCAPPSTSLSTMPQSNNRTTQCPSIPAYLHDQALQSPTKYTAAMPLRRLPAAHRTPTLNSTTIATITDGTFPTPDQNAESCPTTPPSHEPKRRLHPLRPWAIRP